MKKNQKTIADLCLFWGLMFLIFSLILLICEDNKLSKRINDLEEKFKQQELDIEELYLRSKILLEIKP